MAALDAGQAAGGDTRGMQSAAMLIVGKGMGVWLNNDVVLRLQVDDSPEPLKEMRRLVESWNQRRGEEPAAAGRLNPSACSCAMEPEPNRRQSAPIQDLARRPGARSASPRALLDVALVRSSNPLAISTPPRRDAARECRLGRRRSQHAAGEVREHDVPLAVERRRRSRDCR